MFIGEILQVEVTDIALLGGLILQLIGVIWGGVKLWAASKKRTEEKIERAKSDIKEYVDDHIKIEKEQRMDYEAYNTRTHGEIRTDITMLETRTVKAHDEIREDYVRGNEALEKLINAKFDALATLIQTLK